jgi:hypothetical protein
MTQADQLLGRLHAEVGGLDARLDRLEQTTNDLAQAVNDLQRVVAAARGVRWTIVTLFTLGTATLGAVATIRAFWNAP